VIKFIKFIAHNLLWYEDVEIALNNQGLVYLSGKNGAGKSLLFDAIQDAIFKTTPRGLKKADIANKQAFYTCLKVKINGDRYVIEYFRNHEKHKNGYRITKNDVQETPHGIPACERYVKQIFGLSEHEWSTIYYSQRSLSTLVDGTPTERQAYLDKLFNIIQYDDVISRVKEASKELKSVAAEIKSTQVLLDDAKTECESLPSLLDLKEEMRELRHKLKDATVYKDTCESDISDLRDLLKKHDQRMRLRKELANYDLDIDTDQIRADLKECKESLKVITDTKADLIRKDKYAAQLSQLYKPSRKSSDIREDIERLVQRKEKNKSLLIQINKRDALANTIAALPVPDISEEYAKESYTQSVQDYACADARITSLRERIRNMRSLVGAECPTCGQSVDQNMVGKHRKEIQAEIDSLLASLKKHESSKNSAKDAIDCYASITAEKEKLKGYPDDDHDEVVTRLEKISDTLDAVRGEQLDASTWENLHAKMSEITATGFVGDLERQEVKLDAKIVKLEKSLESCASRDTLRDQLRAIPKVDAAASEKSLTANERALEVTTKDIEAYRASLTRLDAQVDTTTKALGKISRLEQQLKEYEASQHKMYLLENLQAAFKKLKQARRQAVLQAIMKYMYQYSSLLFEPSSGITFGLNEDEDSVAFMCHRKGYEPYDIRMMSGGEKSRVTIALLLTLPLLVSPHKRSNLLILDEVDSALDANGKEMLTHSVFPTLRKLFPTIFVVSHNTDIDVSAFDQVWQVVRKKRISKLIKVEKTYE
jgi:DNA repair exonuclease SbcCD ATPase subunit